MGLFFQDSDMAHLHYGSSQWPQYPNSQKKVLMRGNFYENINQKQTSFKQFFINDQEIFLHNQKTTRSLKLWLTAIEEDFYLINQQHVYAIKLIRNDLITIIYTYERQLFILFYSFLAKYCILKNFHKHFKLTNQLGSGSFSTVYQGKNIFSGHQVALKIFNKKQILKMAEGKSILINEIQNLQKLRKYNLSPLIQVYETQDCIILVLQKAQAGNMVQYIQSQHENYNGQMVRQIMLKLLQNLKQLHSAGFIHRDIKPQNVLFSAKTIHSSIFLSDFGLTVVKGDHHSHIAKLCSGTLGFIAPQVLHTNQYDQKCDLFSAGCLMYFLHIGKSIFSGKGSRQIYQMTKNTKAIDEKIAEISNIDEIGRNLLKQLLKINPKQRISANDAVHHQYFKDQKPYKPWAGQDDQTIRDYLNDRISKYWS